MKHFYMLFLVLLAFSGWIYVADAQDASAWIPDADLRKSVRSTLDLAHGDTLTQADMEDLTSLTAQSSQISNITGLEHATSLTRLDLRDNSIVTITALSGLTSLERLRLKNNDIVDITALSGLTSLTLLNLRDNDIVDITALSNLTNLEHLRVDDNSITDVQPLTGLSNLEKLWIAGNSLTNAHLLSSLTNLTTIDITIPDPPDTTAPTVEISVPSGTQNGAFNATITFNESVSGFVQSELDVSGDTNASITSWSPNADNTVFTATITPTTSGTVTLNIAADVATDAANNGNTAATSQSVTVTIAEPAVTPQADTTPVEPVVAQQQGTDTTAPDVSISVPSGTQTGAFDATITFTEAVSDFVQGDVSLSGTATASITNWTANADDTVFTATITPTTSGTVMLDIAADVATDAASNGNTAATTQTVTVDVDVPTVEISVPSGTQNGAFNATITFNEVVSDFVQGDLSLGGSATASITAWDTTDNTVFTATITPTTSGTVTLDVAADVTTDAANNGNTTATQQTVTVTLPGSDVPDASNVDTTQPEASITVDAERYSRVRESVVVNGPFNMTVTFTESVSGFEQSDLSIIGGRASITDFQEVDDQTYTFELTPDVDDENNYVTYEIHQGVATDAAGNPNVALIHPPSAYTKFDFERPYTYISLPDSDVDTATFNVEIRFGPGPNSANFRPEKAIDFVQSDLTLTNNTAEATITDWSVSIIDGDWDSKDNNVYTAEITVTQSGHVTFSVAEGITTDRAGNSNTASTPKTVTVALPGSDVPDASDLDTTQPEASITVDAERYSRISESVVVNGPFNLTVAFTESVSGFEQSDLSIIGGRASITDFQEVDNQTYTFEITPDVDDDNNYVTYEIQQGVAIDAAGNPNVALIHPPSAYTKFDFERPQTHISVPDSDVGTTTFNVEIRFGPNETNFRPEKVIDFVQSGLSLTNNTAEATITDWSVSIIDGDWDSKDNNVYTAEITVTQSGHVTFSVAEGVTTDRAGNSNTASTLKTVTVALPGSDVPDAPDLDTTQPEASITVDAERYSRISESVVVNGPFNMTVTFTESVSGFEQSDLSIIGGRASITDFQMDDDTTYTFEIAPDVDDDNRYVTYEIQQGVATDAAGNPNAALIHPPSAYTKFDFERPYTYISLPDSDVDTATFNVEIRFGPGPNSANFRPEKAIDFVQSDLTLTNNTAEATITDWSVSIIDGDWDSKDNNVYTAKITVTQSGHVTFSVAEDVTTDRAGNSNTASTLKTVTVTLPEVVGLAPENSDIPVETSLLPNYPNPFNPETWMPYHLAKPSDVTITIYDTRGSVIRRLELGHQPEGYYTSRSHAAYWDGRNNVGERVASGIYFYQLQADNMSLLRKMLILK